MSKKIKVFIIFQLLLIVAFASMYGVSIRDRNSIVKSYAKSLDIIIKSEKYLNGGDVNPKFLGDFLRRARIDGVMDMVDKNLKQNDAKFIVYYDWKEILNDDKLSADQKKRLSEYLSKNE